MSQEISDAKLQANQKNALLGGVKTEEGKKISRLNAIKYGFFSETVTDYDKISCEDFCRDIYECFSPATCYEEQLVEIILSNLLTYRRISFVEHELIKQRLNPTVTKNVLDDSDTFLKVIKEGYQPHLHGDIVEELEKFQRYKTATVNLILKTQHELERLSRLRIGEAVPAPLAVDVNVSANP